MIEKIKKWYKGDPGDMKWDPLTDTYVGTRKPSKHWTAVWLSKFFGVVLLILQFIKSEWKYFLTTILTFIGVLLAVLSYIDKMKVC